MVGSLGDQTVASAPAGCGHLDDLSILALMLPCGLLGPVRDRCLGVTMQGKSIRRKEKRCRSRPPRFGRLIAAWALGGCFQIVSAFVGMDAAPGLRSAEQDLPLPCLVLRVE